jgi:hypothetical protein
VLQFQIHWSFVLYDWSPGARSHQAFQQRPVRAP